VIEHESLCTALKIGTTACVLSLLEDGRLPRNLVPRRCGGKAPATYPGIQLSNGLVHLENGKTIGALDVQWEFHHLAQKYLRNSSGKLTGSWKTGDSFSKRLQIIIRRSLRSRLDYEEMVTGSIRRVRRIELGRSVAAKRRP